jgi:hypothetical protein
LVVRAIDISIPYAGATRRRAHAFMAEPYLHRANVIASFRRIGPEGTAGGRFAQAAAAKGFSDRAAVDTL